MERVEKYDATPDTSLFPKLGQTGYTVAEALAELIDNSIDARDEKVNISIKIDRNAEKISIEDNGVGMNKNKAQESIILGRSNKKLGELGQFGIG
ncbi:MAG TPA: ATP-binding protein, partial [Patescibacteria group bacterium]|nr:ATP-binding protein [Patescibacteria group bacterium]